MIDNIKLSLQSLGEIPKDKFPKNLNNPNFIRAYPFSIYTYLLGGVSNVFFVIIFAFLSVNILAIYTIFSVIVWISAAFLMRKGYVWTSYAMVAIELIVHSVLCVVVIGWDAGFQYYIFMGAIIIFFSNWKISIKILHSSIYTLVYIAMAQYALMSNPYIELRLLYLAALNYINIISAISITAIAIYAFYNTNIKLEKKLEKEHQKTNKLLSHLNSELTEAAEYVKTILPQPISNDSVQIDWRFIPSTSLGGDAFGYHMVDEDHLAIYIIDVSGHGVGAALLSVSVINVLRSHSLPKTDFKQPDQVLKALNIAFPSESNKDMFFTIWYGVYNKADRNLSYACGGHPPAILIDSNEQNIESFKLLKTPNYVIGSLSDSTFSKDECYIQENDKLYIFSDGVYEVEKKDGLMWRFKDFQGYIEKISSGGNAVLDKVYSHVKNININDVLADDFTILEVVFR